MRAVGKEQHVATSTPIPGGRVPYTASICAFLDTTAGTTARMRCSMDSLTSTHLILVGRSRAGQSTLAAASVYASDCTLNPVEGEVGADFCHLGIKVPYASPTLAPATALPTAIGTPTLPSSNLLRPIYRRYVHISIKQPWPSASPSARTVREPFPASPFPI